MNQSSQHPISDELLSAYLDGDVTEEEKKIVETAIATDPEVAWQVDTLRQTIQLLRDLPSVALPRSFVLSEEQVADVIAKRRAQAAEQTATEPSFWQQWLRFFSAGNLALRNASAVAAALFVVLVLSEPFLAQRLTTRAEPEVATLMEAPVEESAAPSPAQDAADEATASTMRSQPVASPAARGYAGPAVPQPTVGVPATQRSAPPQERASVPTQQDDQEVTFETADASGTEEDVAQDVTEEEAAGDAGVTMEAPAEPVETFALEAPAAEADAGVAEAQIATESLEEEVAPEEAAEEAAPEAGTTALAVASPEADAGAGEVAPNGDADVETEAAIEQEVAPADDTLVIEPTAEPAGEVAIITEIEETEIEETEIEETEAEEITADAPRPDVWRVMQVGTLLLALVLLILWVGSHRSATKP